LKKTTLDLSGKLIDTLKINSSAITTSYLNRFNDIKTRINTAKVTSFLDEKKTFLENNESINSAELKELNKQALNSIAKVSNSKIASCSDDTTVRIWDINSGKCIKFLNDLSRITKLAVFDKKFLVTAGYSEITIWDIENGTIIRTFLAHSDENIYIINDIYHLPLPGGPNNNSPFAGARIPENSLKKLIFLRKNYIYL
jgi:WD40 repeat protein